MINPKRLYYIDDCLPSGTVHILAGPSGAGKTTLLFHLVKAWQRSQPFLGKDTRGAEDGVFYYVMGDHGPEEANEHMERLGVAGLFKFSALATKDATPADFYKCPKNTKILAIDGAECLVEGANLNSFGAVRDALIQARTFAEEHDLAVIFLVGTPKMKEGESYIWGRENVLGSSAWARFASTIFSLSIDSPGNINDPRRTLSVFPRHRKIFRRPLVLGDTGFVTAPDPNEAMIKSVLMGAVLPGQWLTRMDLTKIAAGNKVTEATLDAALADMLGAGILIKNAEGKFSQRPLAMSLLLPGTNEGGPIS